MTANIYIRRAVVILFWLAVCSVYFGAFILAEHDAYGHGHNGFVHNPVWLIGMLLGLALVIPATALQEKLWRR